MLESRVALNIIAFFAPVATFCTITPPATLAGLAQSRLVKACAAIELELNTAVLHGWTPDTLEHTLLGLRNLDALPSALHWVQIASGIFLFWIVLHQVVSAAGLVRCSSRAYAG